MTYKLKKPNDLYDFIIKNGKLQGYIGKSKTVIIPKLVTSIEKDTFFCNNRIVNIYIPHTITKISKRAFNHCLSLKNINVSKDNIKYSSIDGNLYNKKQTYLLQYATGKTNKQFIVPNTVKTINQSCFKHNLFLETIIMEKNVKEIKEEAFSNCEKVKSIKL